MQKEEKFLWPRPGCLCQGCINLPATHDSDNSSESTTASDGSIDDDFLAEEIITDDF